jgi:hypothetical protein
LLQQTALSSLQNSIDCINGCRKSSLPKAREISRRPLKHLSITRPHAGTTYGGGPTCPSAYCHSVHLLHPGGTTGVGPYCDSHSQHSLSVASAFPASCSFRYDPPIQSRPRPRHRLHVHHKILRLIQRHRRRLPLPFSQPPQTSGCPILSPPDRAMGGNHTSFPHLFCSCSCFVPSLFSCHPSPQAEDLLLLLPLPVFSVLLLLATDPQNASRIPHAFNYLPPPTPKDLSKMLSSPPRPPKSINHNKTSQIKVENS